MNKNEKIGVGVAFVGAMVLNTVVTYRYATVKQFRIDQEEMTAMFTDFLENDLPEILKAEREAERARNKPSILDIMKPTKQDGGVNLDPLFEAVDEENKEEENND